MKLNEIFLGNYPLTSAGFLKYIELRYKLIYLRGGGRLLIHTNKMKSYYKIMLGRKSMYAQECYEGGFIGIDYNINQNLERFHTAEQAAFSETFVEEYFNSRTDAPKITLEALSNMIWTFCFGINIGDVVLCPNGRGSFLVGEVTSEYFYVPDSILPHRRAVTWKSKTIRRNTVSESLRIATLTQSGSNNITEHSDEIERLIQGTSEEALLDPTIVDLVSFGLERHLEDFLVDNWKNTELGKDYDILESQGELVGQQFPTDTGRIDILAISKNKKEFLVVELKRGRVSDVVVGQIQRYMGYIKAEKATEGQTVKGVIIGLEDDIKIRRALSVANNIVFYQYQVNFKLVEKSH